MNIEEVIVKLKGKYNYNDEFLKILYKIMNAMISYYGEEYKEKIFNTFLETPIGFFKDIKEAKELDIMFGIKRPYNTPIIASGGFAENFQLDNNNQLERITSIIIKNDEAHTKDMTEFYATLIHEICHAFMNYNKWYIKDDKIISFVGLIETTISLDTFEFLNERYTPIEEGMNEYDARKIASLIFDDVKGPVFYRNNVNYVSPLMNNESIRKIINSSRINGDNNWKQILGEELSDKFLYDFENFMNTVFDSTLPKIEHEQKIKIAKEKTIKTFQEVSNIVNTMYNAKER